MMFRLVFRNNTGRFFDIIYHDEKIGYVRRRMDDKYSLLIFCAQGEDRLKTILDDCNEDSIMPYIILAGYEK